MSSYAARSGLRFSLQLGALIALCVAWVAAVADDRDACLREYQPSTGQSGKDVVWVPTSDALVTRMLQMADVKPTDLVYDLGAGDGKIAIAAAKQFGARAVGVEYNPDMVRLAQCYVRVEGVADRVRIIQGDIFETDFSEATVVTLYLLPELNLRLRPTILKMKPGTRVVSHSFLMDDWEPDESSIEDGHAYFWVVPADVAGTWTFQAANAKERFDARISQTFQRIAGTAGPRQRALREATLRGDRIQFTFEGDTGPVKVEGRVNGNRIEAQVMRNGTTTPFVGTRKR